MMTPGQYESRYRVRFPMLELDALRLPHVGRATIRQWTKDGLIIPYKDPLGGLSVRASNCCFNNGFKTKDSVMEAIQSGNLKLGKVRNLGWKTWVEIHIWLGIKEPKRKTRHFHCPHCGKESKWSKDNFY